MPSGPGAGSSGLIPAGGSASSPGRMRITSVPGSRAAISRYSALAGSTTSHGIPARVAAASRPRTVWDFPAPVAPQTNVCRFSEARGTASSPAGTRFQSSTIPTGTAGSLPVIPAPWAAVVSGETSKSGRSTNRMPGTSRAGGRASAATSREEASNGHAGAQISSRVWDREGPDTRRGASPAGRTCPAAKVSRKVSSSAAHPGTGARAYGRPSRSAEAHSNPATCAAACEPSAPATKRTVHSPVAVAWRSSACRADSRCAASWAGGLSDRCAPSCARDTSATRPPSRPAGTGLASTSHAKGSDQTDISPSSSEGRASRSCRPASLLPSSESVMPASCIQHGMRASSAAVRPGGSGSARAPGGKVSTIWAPSVPPTRPGPATNTRTGPPACSRIQPNATGAP